MNTALVLSRSVAAAAFRAAPKLRGKTRIATSINSAYLRRGAPPEVLAKMKLGHKLYLDLRAQAHCRAYFTGWYDDEKIRTISEFIKPGGAVLDIGANIGFYATPLSIEAQKRGAFVLAFEPVQSNGRMLARNLRLNDCTATTFAFGLSDRDGQTEIVLAEDFEDGAAVGNAVIVDKGWYPDQWKRETISFRRLDDVWQEQGCPRVDLIKLDVEGHEPSVLKGASKTIEASKPMIFMEFNKVHCDRTGTSLDDFLNLLQTYEIASRDDEDVLFRPKGRSWSR